MCMHTSEYTHFLKVNVSGDAQLMSQSFPMLLYMNGGEVLIERSVFKVLADGIEVGLIGLIRVTVPRAFYINALTLYWNDGTYDTSTVFCAE